MRVDKADAQWRNSCAPRFVMFTCADVYVVALTQLRSRGHAQVKLAFFRILQFNLSCYASAAAHVHCTLSIS